MARLLTLKEDNYYIYLTSSPWVTDRRSKLDKVDDVGTDDLLSDAGLSTNAKKSKKIECDENGVIRDYGDESLKRSKKIAMEYALNNDFNFFTTLTFSGNSVGDRKDARFILKTLFKWLNHLKERKAPKLKYLLIPECHKDGSLHLHGFFMGIEHLLEKVPANNRFGYAYTKVNHGIKPLYFMPCFLSRFGRNQFVKITNSEKDRKASALYTSKYFSKDVSHAKEKFCLHTIVFASKGLLKDNVLGSEKTSFRASKRCFDFLRKLCYGKCFSNDFTDKFEISKDDFEKLRNDFASVGFEVGLVQVLGSAFGLRGTIERYHNRYSRMNWETFVSCFLQGQLRH